MANETVRATTRGYVGGVLREPGDVFVWPDGNALGSWVEVIDGKGEVVEAETADEPEAVKPKAGGKKKAETVKAPTAAPFADPPEPVRARNEVNDATGSTAPDWVQG